MLVYIAQTVEVHSPSSANVDKAALHINPVAFIHRFASYWNEHLHFHFCVVEDVFELVTRTIERKRAANTH